MKWFSKICFRLSWLGSLLQEQNLCLCLCPRSQRKKKVKIAQLVVQWQQSIWAKKKSVSSNGVVWSDARMVLLALNLNSKLSDCWGFSFFGYSPKSVNRDNSHFELFVFLAIAMSSSVTFSLNESAVRKTYCRCWVHFSLCSLTHEMSRHDCKSWKASWCTLQIGEVMLVLL